MKRQERPQLARLILMGFVLWGVFTLYAGSLSQTTLYDDPGIMKFLSDRTVVSVFGIPEYIKGNSAINYGNYGNYRPFSLIPWLLVRDWFGWFRPDMLHMINIAAHILCTALLASLAWRLSKAWKLPGLPFMALAALFFGLFPFSFQSVLWPSAVVHPIMTLYGLAGVHAYLTYRTWHKQRGRLLILFLCLALLLASCLSHEQGFTFCFLVLLVEALWVWREHRRLNWVAVVLALAGLAYILLYRLLLSTFWTNPEDQVLSANAGAILTNVAYHAQGMVVWLLIILRNIIGLPANKEPILLAMLVLNCAGLLLLLWRMKLLTLGWLCLAWWGASIAPSALFLSNGYVLSGPRLMYAGAVGIALLYAGVVLGILARLRRRSLQVALLGGVAVLCAWCVPYILDRSNEMDRLTNALRNVDATVKTSAPTDMVLLINMPWWTGPAYPAFLIGSEGMLIFQEGSAPAWTLIASVGNTERATDYVHHPSSEKQGSHFFYGVAGRIVDDAGLKGAVLNANYVFRFDYDSPGTRSQLLAQLRATAPVTTGLARLNAKGASVVLQNASAVAGKDSINLNLTWSDANGFSEPVAIFVHGFNAQGQQVLVADRDLVDGALMLNDVPPHTTIQESRLISISMLATPVVQLQIGVYSRVTGERFRALQADGSLWPGESVVVPVDVIDSQRRTVQ
jgi:hypothetical protein